MKSIKDSIDDFVDPLTQELKNIGDGVVDGVSDAIADRKERGGKYSKPQKKGCLWTVIKWYLIIVVIGAVLSECGSEETAPVENNVPVTTPPAASTQTPYEVQPSDTEIPEDFSEYSHPGFIEKQIEYATRNNIELNRFPKKEAALNSWLENPSGTMRYVCETNLFGGSQYKITEDFGEYLYYGDLKDNRPDGYGILFEIPDGFDYLLAYENGGYVIRYIGHFANGRFDGLGYLFTESETGASYVSSLRPYVESTGENIDYFLTWANYVEYFGEFSEGYKDGLGNSFGLYDIYFGSYGNESAEIDLDNPRYNIDIGKYKKGQLNGKNKQYIGEYLYYDGESKNGMFDGYGITYYVGTNITSYEGEFKSDMRHGTGTSYSETGEIIYQGEWHDDDYA